jgi:hypothetical protein
MIPPVDDPLWREIVLGRSQHRFRKFSANFLIGRIVLSTRIDPSPENITLRIKEIHDFFAQNEKSTQVDLQQIVGLRSDEKTHVGT